MRAAATVAEGWVEGWEVAGSAVGRVAAGLEAAMVAVG